MDRPRNATAAVMSLECWLYKQTDKPLEVKAAMFWGALRAAEGEIDWDTQRLLFGEFMSKLLKLR